MYIYPTKLVYTHRGIDYDIHIHIHIQGCVASYNIHHDGKVEWFPKAPCDKLIKLRPRAVTRILIGSSDVAI